MYITFFLKIWKNKRKLTRKKKAGGKTSPGVSTIITNIIWYIKLHPRDVKSL